MRRLDAEDEKGKHIGGFQNRLDYIPGCHCYDPGGITIVIPVRDLDIQTSGRRAQMCLNFYW